MKKIAYALAALVLAAPASARSIHVAKDGSGVYKTVYDALTHAADGDELIADDIGKVGAAIQKDGTDFLIKGIVAGSAAEKAGLKAGDKIVLINDRDIARMSVEDAVPLMRGKPGTTLKLHIQKVGDDEARPVEIVRLPLVMPISDRKSKITAALTLGDNDAYARLLKDFAAGGDMRAQQELAFDYYYGAPAMNIEKDEREGARLAKAAVDHGGGKEIQRLWGSMLTDGVGVAKDPEKGAKWLQRAMDAGDAWATYLLGRSYEYGLGVPRSTKEALALYEKAVKAGATPTAQEALDKLKASQNQTAARPAAAQSAPAPAPAPQAALSREEIKQMMSEALHEQAAQKPAAETPAEKSSEVDAPNYSKKTRPDDLAVVIGIEKYQNLPAASFAERDATAVRAHLVALGYPERNIFSLIGPQATKSAFTKELEARLKKLVKPDSTVFVYYSGHGAPDPKSGAAYLVPYDGDPEFLDETAYSLKRLYAKLGALKARRVIVALDSCFSGAGGHSVLAKGVRPLVTRIEAVEPSGPVAALTASSGGEISGALDEQGHGLFTYYFLKGLNDGDMTLGALHGYLKSHVEDEARRHNRDQTPQLIGAGAGETPLDK